MAGRVARAPALPPPGANVFLQGKNSTYKRMCGSAQPSKFAAKQIAAVCVLSHVSSKPAFALMAYTSFSLSVCWSAYCGSWTKKVGRNTKDTTAERTVTSFREAIPTKTSLQSPTCRTWFFSPFYNIGVEHCCKKWTNYLLHSHHKATRYMGNLVLLLAYFSPHRLLNKSGSSPRSHHTATWLCAREQQEGSLCNVIQGSKQVINPYFFYLQ